MINQSLLKGIPIFGAGVAQIAIIVQDLEEVVRAFWSLFGISPWYFYTYGYPLVKKMTYYGEPANYKMRVALANWENIRIELIESLEGQSIYADFIAKHGYGFHHVGILVEDMQSAIQLAESAGLRVIQDGSGFGLDGDGHFAYLDTEPLLGVIIELIQRPKRRTPPEKIFPSENPIE